MQCVHGRLLQESQFVVASVVLYNPSEQSNLKADLGKEHSDRKAHNCLALVDTGATHSCITRAVADKLRLTHEGTKSVGGIHGERQTNTYSVGLIIPEVITLNHLSACEAALPDEVGAILGIDVLRHGVLHLDFRANNFTFCT